MADTHEPLLTDPRSYESEDGDVLPLEIMTTPAKQWPETTKPSIVQSSEHDIQIGRIVRRSLADRAIQQGIPDVEGYVDAQLADVHDRLYGVITPAEKEKLNDERISLEESLELLHKGLLFYPQSSKEKDAMIGIVGRSGVGFPTISYFDEIEDHNKKLKKDQEKLKEEGKEFKIIDPVEALRSNARRLEGYATQADMDVKQSQLFIKTMAERPIDMDRTLSENFTIDEIASDDPTRRVLRSLARVRELELFIDGEATKNPLDARNGIDTLKGKALITRILELLDMMPMSDIMKLNEHFIDEQNNRFDYWKKSLAELHLHGAIRAQVDESVARLEKLRPTSA